MQKLVMRAQRSVMRAQRSVMRLQDGVVRNRSVMTRRSRVDWLAGVIAAVVIAFTFGSVAMAQQGQYDRDDPYGQQRQSDWQQDRYQRAPMGQHGEVTEHFSATELIGVEVFSQDGEKIGSVENIVLDQNRQQALYVVVSESAGFLGLGKELHAVPWTWVMPSPQNDRVTIPIDEQTFDESPGITSNYPTPMLDREVRMLRDPRDWAQASFSQRSNGDWGNGDRYGDRYQQEAKMRRVTELIGMDVKLEPSRFGDEFSMYDDGYSRFHNGGTTDLPSGAGDDYYRAFGNGDIERLKTAGEIDDIMITNTGAVAFALIQPNRDVFDHVQNDELLAVPFARVYVLSDDEVAMANLTEREAMDLTLGENELDRFNDQRFVEDLYSAVGLDFHRYAEEVTRMDRYNGRRTNGDRYRSGDDYYRDDRYRRNGRYDDRYDDQRSRSGDRYYDDRDRYRDREGRTDRRTDRSRQMNQFRHWSNFADQCLGPDLQKADQTISGTVRNIGTFYTSPNAEAPDGERIVVNTRNNRRETVYVGPSSQVCQALTMGRGDDVTIRGTRCTIEGEQVFVATSIQSNGREWVLEEQRGLPQWVPMDGQNRQQQERQGGTSGRR